MNQVVTKGIVLARTNFGEADRILTILTPDSGKIKVIAKGIRKSKSKLAGGVELFSVSNITYIRGKKDIGTLVSSRLKEHFGEIVKDLDKTMSAYDFLKIVQKHTEEAVESEVFELLRQSLLFLNQPTAVALVRVWFFVSFLTITGHSINLSASGNENDTFAFDFESMSFVSSRSGNFVAQHIKFLRLAKRLEPSQLAQIQQANSLARECDSLLLNAIAQVH